MSADRADSPPFFYRNLSTTYPQAVDKPVDSLQRGRASRPPVVESARPCLYTPQQNIFDKVKPAV